MKAPIKGFAAACIFVRPPVSDQARKSFATQMFAWLGMQQFEEDFVGRDDQQVFVGSAVGITVAMEENGICKTNLDKYRFRILLSAQGTRQAADHLVQHAQMPGWRLSHEGFRCFVPKDWVTVRNEQDGMVSDA